MSSITASIPFPRAAAERAAVSPWIIAITVTLATFMELLDTAIANVSLPHIAGGLAVSYDESTWVLTSYLVSNAVVLPLSAWLSRVFGRKRYYMLCVVLFTLSSLLCGLAPSLGLLIFFRVLQGVSGGGLAPVEQAILVDTFPPANRPAAFALYSMAIVTAPVIGPPLGSTKRPRRPQRTQRSKPWCRCRAPFPWACRFRIGSAHRSGILPAKESTREDTSVTRGDEWRRRYARWRSRWSWRPSGLCW